MEAQRDPEWDLITSISVFIATASTVSATAKFAMGRFVNLPLRVEEHYLTAGFVAEHYRNACVTNVIRIFCKSVGPHRFRQRILRDAGQGLIWEN